MDTVTLVVKVPSKDPQKHGLKFPPKAFPKDTLASQIVNAIKLKLRVPSARNGSAINYRLFCQEQNRFLEPDKSLGDQGLTGFVTLQFLEDSGGVETQTPAEPPPAPPLPQATVKLQVWVNFQRLREDLIFPLSATVPDILAFVGKHQPLKSPDGRSVDTSFEVRLDRSARKMNPNETLERAGAKPGDSLLIFSAAIAGGREDH
ncbi:MAG: hypothetical protein JNK87_41800 [Bryobacterales bacterium]|nr:hypothetical protein [Bryobacterales bacterium]